MVAGEAVTLWREAGKAGFQVACDLRYRALLEHSLAHVDAELELPK